MTAVPGMSSHQRAVGAKQEWLTPPWLLSVLGQFDLDPCSPVVRPWPTADRHFTIMDDGLSMPWAGRVWLNPPYDERFISAWMERLATHEGGGTALVFARTETEWFQRWVWPKASALLFLKGRLYFHHVDGREAGNNAGAPSVLVAFGQADAEILRQAWAMKRVAGAFVGMKAGAWLGGVHECAK